MDERFCFLKDDDGHNYLVPVRLHKRFDEALEHGEEDCGVAFCNEFSKYEVGRSISSYSFISPKVD